mmetsp:Transcript_17144/g.30785  ORF Transcript_17144/g.30785 Transcript_17144/m.30785 type:complete len:1536 (-) Transcript_17144:56-4663(-)
MSAEVLHSALGVPKATHYVLSSKETIRPANSRASSAPIEGKRVDPSVTVKRPEIQYPTQLKVEKQPVYQVDMRCLSNKAFTPVLKRTEKPRPKTTESSRGAAELIKQGITLKKDTKIGQAKRPKTTTFIKKSASAAQTPKKTPPSKAQPKVEVKEEKPKVPIEQIVKQTLVEQKVMKMQARAEAEKKKLEEQAKQATLKEFAEYTRENNAYSKKVPFNPKLAWGADQRRLEVKEDERQKEEAKAEKVRMKERREKVQELGRERIGLAAYLEIVQEHNPGWRPKSASMEPPIKPVHARKDRSPDIQHFILSQKRQRKAKAIEEQKIKEDKESIRLKKLKELQDASRKAVYTPKPSAKPPKPKKKLVHKAPLVPSKPKRNLTDLSVSAISGNDSQLQVQVLSSAPESHHESHEPHSIEIQADCNMFDDIEYKSESVQVDVTSKSTKSYKDASAQALVDDQIEDLIKAMDPPVQARLVRRDPYGVWNPASFALGEELTINHMSKEAKVKQDKGVRKEAAKQKFISIKERIEAGIPSFQAKEEEEPSRDVEKPVYTKLLSRETVMAKPPPTEEEVKDAVVRKLSQGKVSIALDDSLGFEIPGVSRYEVEKPAPKVEVESYKEPPELQTIMSSYKFGDSMLPKEVRFLATGSIPEMISASKSMHQSIKESIVESDMPTKPADPKKLSLPNSDEFSTEDEFSVVSLLIKDYFTTPPEDSIQEHEYSQDFDDESDPVTESLVESSHESSGKFTQSIPESVKSASRRLTKSTSRKEISEELSGKKSSGTIPEDIESKQSYDEDFESISESLKHSHRRVDSYEDDFEAPSSRSPIKASISLASSLKRGKRISRPESPHVDAHMDHKLVEVFAKEQRTHNETQMKVFVDTLASIQERSQHALKDMMAQMMAFCSSLASNIRYSPMPHSHSPVRNTSPDRQLAPITPDRRLISHKKLTSDDSIHTIYSDDFEPTESVDSVRSSSADLLRRRKEYDNKLKKSRSKESIINSDSEKSLSYRPQVSPPKPDNTGKQLKLSESAVSISEDFDLQAQASEENKSSLDQSESHIKTMDEYSDDFEHSSMQSSVKFSESKKTQDKYSISSSLKNHSENEDYSEDFESSIGESQSLYRSEDFDKLRVRPVPSIPEIEHSEEQSEKSSEEKESEPKSPEKSVGQSEIPESPEELSEDIYDDDFDDESLENSIPKSGRDLLRESKDSQASVLKSSLEEDVEASSSSQVEWVFDLEPRSISPEKQPVVDEASAEFEHTQSEVEEEPDAYRHSPEYSVDFSESSLQAHEARGNQVADDVLAQMLQQEVDFCLRLLQGSFEEKKVSEEENEVDNLLGYMCRNEAIVERLTTPMQLDPLEVLQKLQNEDNFFFERPRLLSEDLTADIIPAPSGMPSVSELNRRVMLDAIDEAALHNIAGGLLLAPQPWASRTLPVSAEKSQSSEVVAKKVKETIMQWSNTRLGIIPGDEYVLPDGKVDEARLEKDRDARKDEVLNREIQEENALWIEYEMADAQTRLDLADHVFMRLVEEVEELLNGLIR